MEGRVRGGLIIGVTLSAIVAIPVFHATTATARMESGLLLIAESGKPRRLTTTNEVPLPPPVNPAAGQPDTADPSAMRPILDMLELTWNDLSLAEVATLEKLDWNRHLWDGRAAPAAPWPQSMTTKFLNLPAVQKASVRKLGYTPLQWDLSVRQRMLSSK